MFFLAHIAGAAGSPIATPATVDLGTTTVGGYVDKVTTVTNTSNRNIFVAIPPPSKEVFRILPYASGERACQFFTAGEAHRVFGPGQSCEITIRYSRAIKGASTATMSPSAYLAPPNSQPGDIAGQPSEAPLTTRQVTLKAVAVLPTTGRDTEDRRLR